MVDESPSSPPSSPRHGSAQWCQDLEHRIEARGGPMSDLPSMCRGIRPPPTTPEGGSAKETVPSSPEAEMALAFEGLGAGTLADAMASRGGGRPNQAQLKRRMTKGGKTFAKSRNW